MKHFRLAALAAGVLAVPGTASAVVNPPVFKWQGPCGSFCQTGWYSSPAISDLDGDGNPEVIWGSYDLFVYQGSNGALRARAVGPPGQRVWPGVAVADLTGDGTREIVVGRGGNNLHVYRFVPPSTLNVVWSTAAAFPVSGEVRSLAVEDLESDGQLEVIVGRASSGQDRQVNVFNANGAQRAGFPARRTGEEGAGAGMYNENLTVADLNGDGLKEIIAPTDTHYITALHPNGDQILTNAMYDHLGNPGPTPWARVGVHVDHSVDLVGFANCGTQHRPNFANSAPAIGDLDGDGTREIAVPGNVYNCGTSPYTDLYYTPFVFRRDRSRWSGSGFDWTAVPPAGPGSGPLSQDFNVIESAAPNVVLADLDSDGRLEILLPSYDGRLHAWWLDKTERHAWPFDVPGTGIRFAGEPAVADLDNDGQAEVIFTSWGEKAGNTRGQLHIVSSQGVQLHAIDLPAPTSAVWNGGLGAPSLGNIDGDPDLEVVVGTSRTGVLAYDLPGTANARILWGTGRANLQRTGALPSIPPVVSIADAAVAEGSQGATIAVPPLTLSRPSGVPVTVAYATGGGTATAGTDYTAANGIVTFPPGSTGSVAPILVAGDVADEPNETFLVTLSAPSGATLGDAQATVTINDDDPQPVLRISDCAVVEGTGGSSVCLMSATLSGPSGFSIGADVASVSGTATSGVDFTPFSASLSFLPGQTGPVGLGVGVVPDGNVETDEAFGMGLANVTNATAGPPATGTILDDDAPSPSSNELFHGWSETEDLAQAPDVFRLQQAPYSSYEAIVDAVTGDAPAALLERLASDNVTVLQAGAAVGTGTARRLTWQNSVPGSVSGQSLRVGGTACAPPCGADDVYRIRLYDTTYSIARFNNSATQATVVSLQNPTDAAVVVRAMFWDASGTLLRLVESAIRAHGNFVLNTSTVAELAGRSGSITITSDAPYGALTGKAVALEPATGFSFDDVMRPRPR